MRSMPLQNARPAPRTTTTRSLPGSQGRRPACPVARPLLVRAIQTCGRLSIRVATRSSTVEYIVSSCTRPPFRVRRADSRSVGGVGRERNVRRKKKAALCVVQRGDSQAETIVLACALVLEAESSADGLRKVREVSRLESTTWRLVGQNSASWNPVIWWLLEMKTSQDHRVGRFARCQPPPPVAHPPRQGNRPEVGQRRREAPRRPSTPQGAPLTEHVFAIQSHLQCCGCGAGGLFLQSLVPVRPACWRYDWGVAFITELPAATGTSAPGRTSYTWDEINAWV